MKKLLYTKVLPSGDERPVYRATKMIAGRGIPGLSKREAVQGDF